MNDWDVVYKGDVRYFHCVFTEITEAAGCYFSADSDSYTALTAAGEAITALLTLLRTVVPEVPRPSRVAASSYRENLRLLTSSYTVCDFLLGRPTTPKREQLDPVR